MEIEFTQRLTGLVYNRPAPDKAEVWDVSKADAERLIAAGVAKPYDGKPARPASKPGRRAPELGWTDH